MKLRIAVLLSAGLLLSGCSDLGLDKMLSFSGSDDSGDATPAQATAPTVAAAPAASDNFCRAVATQDATSNAFDPATQARTAQKSYAQCQALFGGT